MIKKILLVAIAVILIGTFLMPVIQESADNLAEISYNSFDDSWHYDDYKKSNGASAVSGPLEIVEISGTEYIHATGVGEASINRGGETEHVSISKAKLDVVMALGQSNNAYADVDPDSAPVPQLGTAYYYGTSSAPVTGQNYTDLGSAKMLPINVDGASAIGDKAPAFCKEYYEKTGHKVYYINGSWNGTSIVQWQPGQIRFNAASVVLESAKAEINPEYYDVSYTGYTWIQGETDNSVMDPLTYKTYFIHMNEAIMSGGLGEIFSFCAMCKIAPNFVNVSTAQLELGKEQGSVTLITPVDSFTMANGMMGSDNLHYTQSGDNIVGKELGSVMAEEFHSPPHNGAAKLLEVIPIVVIAALLVAVVAIIIRGRQF